MRWAGVGVGALYPNFLSKADDQASPEGILGQELWNTAERASEKGMRGG